MYVFMCVCVKEGREATRKLEEMKKERKKEREKGVQECVCEWEIEVTTKRQEDKGRMK